MIDLIKQWIALQPGYVTESPTRFYCELTGKSLATRYLKERWVIDHNNIEEAIRDCVQEARYCLGQRQDVSGECFAVINDPGTHAQSHAEACLKCWIACLKYKESKKTKAEAA